MLLDALGNFLVGFIGLCGWVGGWVWVSWYTPFILYYLPLIGFALIFYFAEDGVVQQNGAYLMVSGFFIYMAVILCPHPQCRESQLDATPIAIACLNICSALL